MFDSGAIAAAYGSVSAVTFVTAVSYREWLAAIWAVPFSWSEPRRWIRALCICRRCRELALNKNNLTFQHRSCMKFQSMITSVGKSGISFPTLLQAVLLINRFKNPSWSRATFDWVTSMNLKPLDLSKAHQILSKKYLLCLDNFGRSTPVSHRWYSPISTPSVDYLLTGKLVMK